MLLHHEAAKETSAIHSSNPPLLGTHDVPDAGAIATGKVQPLLSGLSLSRGTDMLIDDFRW